MSDIIQRYYKNTRGNNHIENKDLISEMLNYFKKILPICKRNSKVQLNEYTRTKSCMEAVTLP